MPYVGGRHKIKVTWRWWFWGKFIRPLYPRRKICARHIARQWPRSWPRGWLTNHVDCYYCNRFKRRYWRRHGRK